MTDVKKGVNSIALEHRSNITVRPAATLNSHNNNVH